MAHWRTAFDSEVMTSGDLMGLGDVTATIESASPGFVTAQGKPKKMLLLKLAGFAKPLGANPTNCRTIAGVLGTPDYRQWAGRRIVLFVAMVDAPDPLDKRRTVKTEAIRVRPAAAAGPDAVARAEHPPLSPDQEATVRALCEAIDAAGDESAIEDAIAPQRGAIKAIGGRAAVIVATAKAQRIATIKAAREEQS